MEKEMRDRRTHFNKTVEKIRSTLITSVQNVDNNNTQRRNIKEHNECFFIPSQVTLNESNIINQNLNKKLSKPWSVVISSEENQMEELQQLPMHDKNKENKENVSKFSKLETDLKIFETLVSELNKLSAEEQNIRNKLFPDNLKEMIITHQNNSPSKSEEKNQTKENTRKKQNTSSERIILTEAKKQITEILLDESSTSTSICISSSTSTSTNYVQPSKKTIHFEKKCKKNNQICSNYEQSSKKNTRFEKEYKEKNQINTNYEQPSKKNIHFEKECPEKNQFNTYYEQPSKKNINFDKGCKKKIIQPSAKLNYKEKFNSGKPLQNINNIMQRIKNKKQLLVKELSAGTTRNTDADLKKLKTIPSIPATVPMSKKCYTNDRLRMENPVNYAKLPDSFYNSQLNTLKAQISQKQIKVFDQKNNESINEDLMAHINTLLKMSPSDVDNLSVSSCSSIKLEESVLQHSEKDNEHYCKMLKCISKCLNTDISDINQTVFESPKNINLLNKLQQLSNYYLEKTKEIKNICDETLQIANEKSYETDANSIKENSSINLSSSSSVDGEYILGNLNKLLQKKGIINSDKEWPMFKHTDDDRSLTDQLLDICPSSSYDR
ncbi:PREDICTED: putative leucine-rich repeat-containing protein DDB_G0290503, partial [Diuraphis noxia]|uniref:putative leucine-rich repeat-containing protein DDB_G0290503 n=1 Tax=Diuraphis noxia TaxID=143948 RepID=UPI0007638C04